ncbi:MAG: TetR/AcrR family transcriptional regulator [Eubacteriaceae bacterium]|nr:TetR/AcrR family transcriptional regulator [Eubacteriaceae bacterium]
MNNKNAIKTEQTKYDIKCAFLQLLEIKKLEDITIREISDISGYHRSTIYLYFKNISDILIQIENDILEDFSENLKKEFSKNPPKNLDEFASTVVSAFRNKSSFYVSQPLPVLLGKNGDMSFYNTVKERLKACMNEFENERMLTDDYERDYLIEFVTSGIVSAIRHWFECGMDIPPEMLIGYLAKYMVSMFSNE